MSGRREDKNGNTSGRGQIPTQCRGNVAATRSGDYSTDGQTIACATITRSPLNVAAGDPWSW